MIPLEVRLQRITNDLRPLTPVQQASRLPIRWPEFGVASEADTTPSTPEIRQAMAAVLGVPVDCVAVCPHPDDALRVCAELVITEDVTVPVIQPSPWSHNRILAAAGALSAPHFLSPDLQVPYDELEAIVDTRPPLFLSGYPWDPIGLNIDGEWVFQNAQSVGETLFVLDASWSVNLPGWPSPEAWPLNLVAVVSVAPLVGGDWFHGAALIGHPQFVSAVEKLFIPMGLPRTLRPLLMHMLQNTEQAWERWHGIQGEASAISQKMLELGWMQLQGVGPWIVFQPDEARSDMDMASLGREPRLISLKDYPMIHDWWAISAINESERTEVLEALDSLS